MPNNLIMANAIILRQTKHGHIITVPNKYSTIAAVVLDFVPIDP